MSHGGSINKTFIIDDIGNILSACTSVYTNEVLSCSGDSTVQLKQGETNFNTDITPKSDKKLKVGRRTKRFRELNTVSGTSTVWSSTTINSKRVNTETVDLGYDNTANEQRILNKDTSILKSDKILGGNY